MVTPRTVTALSLLSMDPSHAVLQSARSAASSRHGVVNLTRLVRALDKLRVERADEEKTGSSWLEIQKTWETVLYARALLFALSRENEQSSTTSSILDGLDGVLSNVEVHVQAVAKQTKAPAPPTSLPLIEFPKPLPSAVPALLEDSVEATLDEGEVDSLLADLPSPPLPKAPSSPGLGILGAAAVTPLSPFVPPAGGAEFNTGDYFAKRAREDSQGGEAGLLPLKVQKTGEKSSPMDQEGMRNRLMGGASSVIGSSQLHEELGGQLADMSHRLKLNAMHFANSLEEEKALLQGSQDTLEKNLSNTQDSKGHLAKVSTKGRGTTCLTLGIVVLVMVLFIWTYMIIRFT